MLIQETLFLKFIPNLFQKNIDLGWPSLLTNRNARSISIIF